MQTYYWVSDLINFVTITSIAIFVLWKDPQKKLYRVFAFFCGTVSFWAITHVFLETLHGQLGLMRLVMLGPIWTPSACFHYYMVFLDKDEQKQWLIRTNYVLSGILTIFNFTSHYFIAGLAPHMGLWLWPVPGPLFHLHLIMYSILVDIILITLIQEIRHSIGVRKLQLKYCFWATLLGFAGGMPNYLPCYGLMIKPWGNLMISIYVAIIGYAIVKHHVMDLDFILRRTVAYTLMTGVVAGIMVFLAMLSTHFAESIFGHQRFAMIFAACLITAVFHPIQLRVQVFVDHLLFRGWADQPVAREIAAGFSHELKSPLAGLSLQTQAIVMKLDALEKHGGSLTEAMPKIKQELIYIFNQAMDAAQRIDAVRGVAEPGRTLSNPVQVSDLIKGSLIYLKYLIDASAVSIHQDVPERLVPIRGDGKQLEIVLINLMKNALQAMGSKGVASAVLTVSALEQVGCVLISVRDTGPGIASQTVDRIFEPYYTTKGHKGTGMGLYLAHQIVKAHGGTIDVKSEEGKGTEFIVRLPKYAANAAA